MWHILCLSVNAETNSLKELHEILYLICNRIFYDILKLAMKLKTFNSWQAFNTLVKLSGSEFIASVNPRNNM